MSSTLYSLFYTFFWSGSRQKSQTDGKPTLCTFCLNYKYVLFIFCLATLSLLVIILLLLVSFFHYLTLYDQTGGGYNHVAKGEFNHMLIDDESRYGVLLGFLSSYRSSCGNIAVVPCPVSCSFLPFPFFFSFSSTSFMPPPSVIFFFFFFFISLLPKQSREKKGEIFKS